MIKTSTLRRVDQLERASCFGDLTNFRSLPKNASAQGQRDALYQDAEWMRDHANEISQEAERIADDVLNGVKS